MTELPLAGRTALVTGASRGFGLAVAMAFARAGADLVLCARHPEPLATAAATVRAPGRRVLSVAADVSREDDIRELVAQALTFAPRLDILVNNAGIYGPKGPIEEIDWEAWTEALRINLLGSIQMCRALLPHFKANRAGKIIQLSGGGATNPMPFFSAYAASKAAVVRFVETLAGEVRDFGIDVNAIAPGALNTRLLEEVLAADPDRVGREFHARALRQKEQGGTPLEVGARLAVFLASPASDGLTGKLISAVWDPWERFPAHLAELRETDIYTLRRIVPRDRGRAWGERE